MSLFAIVAPARSGSTSLRESINVIGSVVCHGEILGPNHIHGVSHKLKHPPISIEERQSDASGFMSALLESGSFEISGLKLLYSHFFNQDQQRHIDWIISRRPKIIFLWRRNLIKRYQSEAELRIGSGYLTKTKVVANFEKEIEIDALHQIKMARRIRSILSEHGINQVFDLEFETLISEPDIIDQIVTFLGVSDKSRALMKDKRTQVNSRKKSALSDLSGAFVSPALDRFRDVSLSEVLTADGS